MYCDQCGKENPENAKYCIACGSDFGTSEVGKRHLKRRKIMIIASILIVILLAVAIAIGVKLVSQKRYNQAIALGDKYLKEMNYEDAILEYQNAINIDPKKGNGYI